MNSISLSLSPNVRYRREAFGGIIFESETKACQFYDVAGAFAIEHFTHPKPLESLSEYFADKKAITEFLTTLVKNRILVQADETCNRATAFFTDIEEFPDDRLVTPLGIELELTLKCGRNCSYCAYESSPSVSSPGSLRLEQYAKLFRRFDSEGVCYLRFTGGDPLIRPDSLEILEAADAYSFGLALASDLTVLTEAKAARLAKIKNLVSIQTTLDGPTKKVADRHRGSGNYDKVCEGIDLLRNYGINVMVGTVLTKENVEFIYETALLLKRWDVSYCVSPLYAAGRGREMERSIPTDEDLTRAYEQFAQACSDGLVRPADPAWNSLASTSDLTARHALWKGQPWLIRSPDRVLRIDPSGRCYAGIHLKEFLGESVYVGDITSCDLRALWNAAPLLNRLRSLSHKNPYFGEVLSIQDINTKKGITNEHIIKEQSVSCN